MIRLSIGLETIDDIIWDIDQSLEQARAMMRYAAIPWPLAGIVVAGALVGQEALLTWLGTNPALAQTTYRMLVWTVAAASLALIAPAATARRLHARASSYAQR